MAAQAEENFKEMELWEHLAELRGRMMRSIVYILLGFGIAWAFYGWLWNLLLAPFNPILKRTGGQIVVTTITEGFMTQLQICLVAGLIVAVPLITLELWGFIAPGLTRSERRGFYVCVPLSLLFFGFGLTVAYLMLPIALNYFANYLSVGNQDFVVMQSPLKYIMLVVKLELGFGLVFQLPVILMFLGYVGIVTSRMLRENWRYAMVGCAVVSALITPTPDAFNMAMMAAPLMFLYLTSIWLVALVERYRARRNPPSYDT